jgi:hypothetical protein
MANNPAISPPSLRSICRVAEWWLLPLLGLLPFLGGLPLMLGSNGQSIVLRFCNAAAPIVLFCATMSAAILTIRRYPASVWTPYVAFLVGSAIFFALGPLVYVFGDPRTIAQLAATRMAITDLELARTNLLVELGVLSVFIGIVGYSAIRTRGGRALSRLATASIPLPAIATIFLLLGAVLRYGLILPNQFGLTSYVVPGSVTSASNLFALGLSVAGYLSISGPNRRVWRLIFWAVFFPNLLVAVLEFSKTSAMINLLVPMFGRYLADRNMSRLAGWVIVAVILFAFMQPLVSYGRIVILQETGDIYRASLPRRLDITVNYLSGERFEPAAQRSQPAWTRLAYSGPQAYAMDLHDDGQAGESLRDAWMYFVPRLLWPGKPILLGPGAEFNEIVNGWRGTFLGLSIYGDAYWQAGWPGLLIFSLGVGFIFGWMSRNSLQWMSAGGLVLLPPVLLAFEIGLLGPTKYLINGIVGPLPIYIGYVLLLNLALRLRIGKSAPEWKAVQ